MLNYINNCNSCALSVIQSHNNQFCRELGIWCPLQQEWGDLDSNGLLIAAMVLPWIENYTGRSDAQMELGICWITMVMAEPWISGQEDWSLS